MASDELHPDGFPGEDAPHAPAAFGRHQTRDALAAGLRERGINVEVNARIPLGGQRARVIDEDTGEVGGDLPGGLPARRLTVTGVDPDARAPIPGGQRFLGRDMRQKEFAEGRDIQDIADALIAAPDRDFAFLDGVLIRYRWRRKAQSKAGKAVLGYCQKLSGQLKDEMGGGEFQIVLNAEHCREFALSNIGLEALIAHEMRHIAPPDPDDPESEPSLVGHDVECFADDIREYGLWTADLRRVAPAFEQARLAGL